MNTPEDNDEHTVIRTVPESTPVSAWISASAIGDPDSLRMGTRLGEFEITERIGEGGFSVVYLVWDHSLERKVALKEYMPASIAKRVGRTQVNARSTQHRDTYDAGLRSFINEAKLLARFDHASLVKVYRFWEANGTAYMVMPFYEGFTLRDTVRALAVTSAPGTAPGEAWLRALLDPLTQALCVIHAEQCFHRDISPDNVMLLAGSGNPLLLDFGAARRVIGDMTQALTVILKPGYAPVEQYADLPGMKQGAWTDVYALAAVVYWTITGNTPPVSVGRMLSDSCVPLAECAKGRYSADFLKAIDRALVVRPERRTQNIDVLRRELGFDAVLPAVKPRARAFPLALFVMVLVIAAAVMVASGWMSRPRDAGVPEVQGDVQSGKQAEPKARVLEAGVPPAPAIIAPIPAVLVPSPTPASPSAALPLKPPDNDGHRTNGDGIEAERRPAARTNSAECNRILQHLSLGDNAAALAERYRSLDCR